MIIAPRSFSPIALQGISSRSVAANITSGDGRVGWVSASPGRSTSNILWSCFSILLICAWKSIHFNVPSDEERDAGWHKLWKTLPYWPTKTLWRRWCKRLGFMVMVILAPEIGVAIAMDQYLSAKMVEEGINMQDENDNEAERLRKDIERRSESEGKGMEKLPTMDAEETNTDDRELSTMLRIIDMESVFHPHGYFLSKETKLPPIKGYKSLPRKRNEITKKLAFLANMGGLQTRISFFQQDGKDEAFPEPIEIKLRDWRSLDILLYKFPEIQLLGEDEIDDLSKADAFTKVFACVQSIWLIVQSIARLSAGLPITQLELATMALVFCALLMYALWWDKPFGVERRVTIHANYGHSISATVEAIKLLSSEDPAVITLMKDGPAIAKSTKEYLTLYFQRLLMSSVGIGFFKEDIPTYDDLGYMAVSILIAAEKDDLLLFGKTLRDVLKNLFRVSCTITIPRDFTIFLTFYLTATMFSAFHIGAWNWEFPTPTIRMIWRSFALAATGACPLVIMNIFGQVLVYIVSEFVWTLYVCFAAVFFFFLGVTYVVARLGLIVLIFYCFCSMPAGVYETVHWTDFLPHVA